MIWRFLFLPVVLLMILGGIVGTTYYTNEKRVSAWLKEPKTPGRVLEGSGLYVIDTGGDNKVTVVVLTGLGATVLEWANVVKDLVPQYRVVLIDRPGYTWSRKVQPSNPQNVVKDYLATLRELNVTGQLVVVGHSIGSYYAELLAENLSSSGVGLVLLDPLLHPKTPGVENLSHPDLQTFLNQEPTLLRSYQASRIGLFRFLNMTPYDVPLDIRADVLNNLANPNTSKTVLEEYQSLFASAPKPPIAKIGSLVLAPHSREKGLKMLAEYGVGQVLAEQIEDLWVKSNDRFKTLSTQTLVRELESLGNDIHIRDPKAVAELVRLATPK